jgi:sugar lactone lactonase YvrE
MKVAVGGGNATTLASLGTMPVGIAVDATSVYWLDGKLKQVSIGGGGVTVLSPAAGLSLAVYGSSVYWTDWSGGSVMKCAIAACVPTMLASGQSYPDALAVDGTNVYWANWGTNFNQRKDGTVMKVALGGGAATQLASHQHFPWGIAIDGTSVYWTTISGGTVMKAVK